MPTACTYDSWPESFTTMCAERAGSTGELAPQEHPSANGGWELKDKDSNFLAPQEEQLRGGLHAVCLKSSRRLSLPCPQQ